MISLPIKTALVKLDMEGVATTTEDHHLITMCGAERSWDAHAPKCLGVKIDTACRKGYTTTQKGKY